MLRIGNPKHEIRNPKQSPKWQKIRNPKQEARNKLEIINSQIWNFQNWGFQYLLLFRISIFGIKIFFFCLVFRYSNLEFPTRSVGYGVPIEEWPNEFI